MPVAVCVAEYSAGQLELIQKNQRTQFEKQALTNTDKEERFKFFIAGAATLAVLCGTFFGLVQILKMLS